MSDFFLGEIRMFSFGFAPKGWALCNGAVLTVQQNTALYTLLGNYYGGTAPTNFALPDLRGRAVLGQGMPVSGTPPYYTCGQQIGVETAPLSTAQIPAHNHLMTAGSDTANANGPNTNFLAAPNVPGTPPAAPTPIPLYAAPNAGPAVPLDPGSISATGSNTPHQNMQPFLVTNYCIALTGIYPPRN